MSATTKSVRKLIASTSAIALVAAVLTVGSTTTANAAPTTGGTLYMLTHAEQWEHPDPQRLYVGRDIAFFNSYVYRNLVSYKPATGANGATLIGDLATNTGVPSNNAKTWKFTLRAGVTWEDGSAITCEDVKYGISRTFAQDVLTDGPTYAISMLDVPTLADGSSAYKGPYNKTGQALFDKSIICAGNTVTFKLSRTVADFNYAMTYPAFSPIKKTKDTGDKYDLRPFASGPYKIDKYVIGDEMRLVRNTAWKKSSDPIRTPYPDDIVVQFGLAEDLRDDLILKDGVPNAVNIDALQSTNNKAFFADPTKESQRMNVNDPYVRYYAMNLSATHMDCLDVRKAFFFAINTQALIDLAGGSVFYGAPGDSIMKPNLGPDYAPTTGNIHEPFWSINGNPTKAKEFLDAAKTKCPAAYTRATSTGIIMDLPNTASNQKGSVLIEDAMKAAGIVIKFNFIPSGVYYATVRDVTKQNDISSVGWGPDWANASTVIPELFIKGGGGNYTQTWNDPAYAAFKVKSDKALAETNRAKQIKMWQELGQIIMDNYWIGRPVFTKTQLSWGSKVAGVGFWDPQGTFLFPALYVKN